MEGNKLTEYLLFLLVFVGLIRVIQEHKPQPKKQGRSWLAQKLKNGKTYVKRWFK